MDYDHNVRVLGSYVLDELVAIVPQVEVRRSPISRVVLDGNVVLTRVGGDEDNCSVIR
jgi:hypothetical protein